MKVGLSGKESRRSLFIPRSRMQDISRLPIRNVRDRARRAIYILNVKTQVCSAGQVNPDRAEAAFVQRTRENLDDSAAVLAVVASETDTIRGVREGFWRAR